VPELRAVLVTAPPLLADLIRGVLAGRVGLSVVAEIADPKIAAVRLRDLAPDVVIIGPAANAPAFDAALVRALLPQARVFALSADLTRLFGPGQDDDSEFTPDTLADRLRR
jgi:DNA-binding NarL/FixJ family response regulator